MKFSEVIFYNYCHSKSILRYVHKILLKSRHFTPQKKYILGLGPGCEPKPKPKTEINSEFNSIHFGIEINKL